MKRKKLLKSKNIATVIVILLIFISLISSGCIFDQEDGDSNQEDGHDWPESYTETSYNLNLTSKREINIIWPVPIFDSEQNSSIDLSKLAHEINLIKGKASYQIDQTKYGPALNITFNGTVRLKGYKHVKTDEDVNLEDYFFNELSMNNNDTEKYMVYSSNETRINDFTCYWENAGKDVNVPISFSTQDFKLKKGWQSVKLN